MIMILISSPFIDFVLISHRIGKAIQKDVWSRSTSVLIDYVSAKEVFRFLTSPKFLKTIVEKVLRNREVH